MLYCHFQDDEPFPRSVLRLLWDRYPEVLDAFRDRGIFVIEFQAGSVDVPDLASSEETEPLARAAYEACPSAKESATVLFLAHTRVETAQTLAAEGLRVPAGAFLGACGYHEGGIRFFGADGTFIESDDWEGARDYALRVAARYPPVGGEASAKVR